MASDPLAGTPIPGDPIPWFTVPMLGRDNPFPIHGMGGRHLLLLFYGSTAQPACAEAVRLAAAQTLFDDRRAVMLAVGIDPADVARRRIANRIPGVRFLLDHDRRVSLLYGAADAASGPTAYRPFWLLVDPAMRVIGRFAIDQGERAIAALEMAVAAPAPDINAPVLIIPNVLEPAFCARLIALHQAHGGNPSGVMREIDGKTVGVFDTSVKQRTDCDIDDDMLCTALRARLVRRVVPMIRRAFAFEVTRIERYIVACYDGTEGGYFRPHRDNTTAGTAHRRFAVTINLNGDYEGGDLRFPEFGARTYRAPPGGAVVFGCALMHEATPVRSGRRYATLPFLYDDAAARIREANAGAVDSADGPYRADRDEPAPAAASASG